MRQNRLNIYIFFPENEIKINFMSPSEKIGKTNLFCKLFLLLTFSNTLVLSMKQTPFLSKI